MAVIYLKHEIHGSKVACSTSEAEYDKLHGWEEYDPESSAEPAEPEWLSSPVEENALVAPKRGRKKGS